MVFRYVPRVLPLVLGLVVAATLFAATPPSPRASVVLVCDIGTSQEQDAYQRCLTELPARQADLVASQRAGDATTQWVLSLAGGALAAAACLGLLRARPNVSNRVDTGSTPVA